VSGEPGIPGVGDQRALVARLRAVIEARDTENALLRAELEAQLERYRRLELRVAELERRLRSRSPCWAAHGWMRLGRCAVR